MKTSPYNTQKFYSGVEIKISAEKKLIFFPTFAQNIDCGYPLEPP